MEAQRDELTTVLYWAAHETPDDWDEEAWGDLPEDFLAPRFHAGDHIMISAVDEHGTATLYPATVAWVLIDIHLNVKTGSNIGCQHVYIR